jgi:hypothetical protein
MANLFRAPAVPQVAAAAPMPDPTSPAVLEAGKVATAATMAQAGRQSTIMGKQGQNGPSRAPVATAASDSYAGRTLGAATP